VAFRQRVVHFVPLALYKYLAEQKKSPQELDYLTPEHLDAIKEMPLINRGRLSVQPVSKVRAPPELGQKGGFEELLHTTSKKGKTSKRRSGQDSEDLPEVLPNLQEAPQEQDLPLRQSNRKRAKK